MEVAFKTSKLQKMCFSETQLLKKFGKICANKIWSRLDDLQAASTLEDFKSLPGRCHELKDNRKGQLTLDLEHPLRLVFKPSNNDIQNRREDNGLDWSSVTSVEVIDVEDTHD